MGKSRISQLGIFPKSICTEFQISYRYANLATILAWAENTRDERRQMTDDRKTEENGRKKGKKIKKIRVFEGFFEKWGGWFAIGSTLRQAQCRQAHYR